MTIAASVQNHLSRESVQYDVITHEHTRDSSHSAQAAHIPGDQLAKCVILEDGEGYLMAVLPAASQGPSPLWVERMALERFSMRA